MEIRRAAVIGAGTMGSGIAAHLANAGVPVMLLDIVPEGADSRNAVAEGAIARMLKADPALARTPVIIVSVADERAKGFALGAAEYLVKPVEPQRLAGVITREIGAKRREILVVDDDEDTCELVTRQLRAVGFAVASVRTGEEAIRRLRDTKPALVVLDLCMPGMSGFDVLSQLRAEQHDVRVIVFTGKSLTAAEEQTLRQGMARVVHKDGMSMDEIVVEAKQQLLRPRDARA